MRMFLSIYFCLLLLNSFVTSHTVHFGRSCPNIQAFPNLSVDKILGTWYVAYQLDTSNTCSIWNFTKSDNVPDQLKLTESRQLSGLDAFTIDHKQDITATVSIPNPEIPSIMRIRWPTSLTGAAAFTVFDTDYNNYLAIFQCDRALIVHRRDVTILSKTKNIESMFVDRVRRLLDNSDIGHYYLNQISHEKCRESSNRNWHIDTPLLPLKGDKKRDAVQEISRDIDTYDISEMEIIGDGITSISENFRGSLRQKIPK